MDTFLPRYEELKPSFFPNQSETLQLPRNGDRSLYFHVLEKDWNGSWQKGWHGWLAIKYQVVPQQLFGALPGRSAVDLVSCVIHDAEAAMRNIKVMAMVTLDVQGAFDAVLHKRLLRRMREQGWPKTLCRWVESFLTTRKIRVRHHDGTTEDKVVECGVPQGSPLSPLLFLLYIVVLVQDEGKNNRFGYADDISILAVGSGIRGSSGSSRRGKQTGALS